MAGKLGLFRAYQQDLQRARAAYDQRRINDGLEMLEPYKELLSIDIDLMLLYARLLHAKGLSAEAEELLARLLTIEPTKVQAIRDRADCLAAIGRRPEALVILEAAHHTDRDDNGILGAYLPLLLSERDLPTAIAALRKEHLRRAPPRRLESAIEKLRQKALALYEPAELKRADPDDLLQLDGSSENQSYSLRQIYETFEAIGCNCEFGFVQGKSGAEPLSLLRWTAITPEKLIELLACDLEGYENPEHYSLQGNYEREFHLYESAFGTESHTGINQDDISPEEFLNRMTRRQGFLKRKFLADTAQGRKVFVYKADAPLTEEQMAGIETQLFRLGARYCLFVEPTPNPMLVGRVRLASPQRAIGYLSAVMPDIRYEEWNRIAIATYDHFIRNAGE